MQKTFNATARSQAEGQRDRGKLSAGRGNGNDQVWEISDWEG